MANDSKTLDLGTPKTLAQIRAKYANAIQARRARISLASGKVDRLQMQVDYFTQEREQYRNATGGAIDYDRRHNWERLTAKLTTLKRDLEQAKQALAIAQQQPTTNDQTE